MRVIETPAPSRENLNPRGWLIKGWIGVRAMGAGRLRLLVVENRADRNRALCVALDRYGFDVSLVVAESHLHDVAEHTPDVVLVDVGVLAPDRLELCRRLREAYHAPMLALTVRADPASWMAGFRAGVDDYVVKPYGMEEIVTRIGAVAWMRGRQQRFGRQSPWRLAGDRLVVDVEERSVTVDGARVAVTRKEFDLLVLLAARPGAVQTRERIIGEIWAGGAGGATGSGGTGRAAEGGPRQSREAATRQGPRMRPEPSGGGAASDRSGVERSLEVHIASLRSKIGIPGLIATTRGVGYQLVDTGGARAAGAVVGSGACSQQAVASA
jgi:DNA-binding response OmpR family regulator